MTSEPTKINQFTLKELAHFDRCLFPDDFAKDLVKFGAIDARDKRYFVLNFRRRSQEGNLNVIAVYQSWGVQDDPCGKKFEEGLETLLTDFVTKYHRKNEN